MPTTQPHNKPSASSPSDPQSQSLLPPDHFDAEVESTNTAGGSSSDFEHISKDNSRAASPNPSPFAKLEDYRESEKGERSNKAVQDEDDGWDSDRSDSNLDELDYSNMPSDLRPPFHRPASPRSYAQPLLDGNDKPSDYENPSRPLRTRRSNFSQKDPEDSAKENTRKRYTYAGAFLLLSLVSFTIQTETAVYIQHNLGWRKAYCML